MVDRKYHNNLYGIIFMIMNGLSLAVLYAVVKILREDLDSSLIVFLYKSMILLLILPWVFSEGISAIKTPYFKLHLTRGFLSTMGSLCWAYGIKFCYIATATAILQMEQVLWVIMGLLFFNEKITKTKLAVIVIAVLGAVIIIFSNDRGNGGIGFHYGYVFIILAVVFYTVNSTVVKVLGQKAKNKTQVFYVMLFSMIFSAPFAFFDWEIVRVLGVPLTAPVRRMDFSEFGLELWHFKYLAILAVCYFTHAVSFFLSLRYGDLSVIMPFFYSKLVSSVLIGYIFLSESLSKTTLLGVFFIFLGGTLLVRYENRKQKRRKGNGGGTGSGNASANVAKNTTAKA